MQQSHAVNPSYRKGDDGGMVVEVCAALTAAAPKACAGRMELFTGIGFPQTEVNTLR